MQNDLSRLLLTLQQTLQVEEERWKRFQAKTDGDLQIEWLRETHECFTLRASELSRFLRKYPAAEKSNRFWEITCSQRLNSLLESIQTGTFHMNQYKLRSASNISFDSMKQPMEPRDYAAELDCTPPEPQISWNEVVCDDRTKQAMLEVTSCVNPMTTYCYSYH